MEGKIAGILHTINDGLGDVVMADKLDLLYGKDYITEEILGLKFKISPFSFLAVDNLTEKPDLIVLDPPREGIHPKAINKIIDFNPETFVYVSCNPITLVRDLRIFKERGYEVKKAKLMDMFPRTPHTEVVVLLHR